jgi:hypothetical protein
MRICFFDIVNIYNNTPKIDIINITINVLENNHEIDKNNQKETLHILQTVMEQNYFWFDQDYYKQTNGLPMGAPTSSIIVETYIQHMEHKYTLSE